MNASLKKEAEPIGEPVFHRVGENLYRLESSGGYYGLVKKGGKQFRRSLDTGDRKLAERRLKGLKDKISDCKVHSTVCLSVVGIGESRRGVLGSTQRRCPVDFQRRISRLGKK